MKTPILAALTCLSFGACGLGSAPISTGNASRTAPLIGGTPSDLSSVVSVGIADTLGGPTTGLCSGSLMGPQVVLTARHCVEKGGLAIDPALLTVRLGASSSSPERAIAVTEIRTPLDRRFIARAAMPPWGGADFAVLILAEAITDVPPLSLRRAPIGELAGAVTLVGFGQRDDGPSGTRYQLVTEVVDVKDLIILLPPSACPGDSGGPLLDGDDAVTGVASFISGSGCSGGSGTAAYGAIAILPGLVDEALRDTDACDAAAVEVCDGFDNDCDFVVDEGCAGPGERCADRADCAGWRDCEPTSDGRACALPCAPDGVMDAFDVVSSCPAGLACERSATSCFAGLCLPVGSGEEGASCARAADCASRLCATDADGTARCRTPCLGEQGLCAEGLVCAVDGEGCGSCLEDGPAPPEGCAATGAPWGLVLLPLLLLRRRRRFVLATMLLGACGPAPGDDLAPYQRPDLAVVEVACNDDSSSLPYMTYPEEDEIGQVTLQALAVPAGARVLSIGVYTEWMQQTGAQPTHPPCGCDIPVSLLAVVGARGAAGAPPSSPRVIYEAAPVERACSFYTLVEAPVTDRIEIAAGETLFVGARYGTVGGELTCFPLCDSSVYDDNAALVTIADGTVTVVDRTPRLLQARAVVALP